MKINQIFNFMLIAILFFPLYTYTIVPVNAESTDNSLSSKKCYCACRGFNGQILAEEPGGSCTTNEDCYKFILDETAGKTTGFCVSICNRLEVSSLSYCR